MDKRHFDTVIALAEELHFGRAAKRLHVVQSAVSQTLRAVEDELGLALFERSRRYVRLTSAGAAFVAAARVALKGMTEPALAAHRAAAGLAGSLRLMFTLVSALTPLPRAIVRFREQAPDVDLSITAAGTVAQLAAVEDGRCDVGFVTFTPDIGNLQRMHVSREQLMTLIPSAHPLAKRRVVRFRDLSEEPIIMLSSSSEPHIARYYRMACERAGFVPKVVLEVEQLDTLLAFVGAGLGLSHAPASVMRMAIPGVAAVPLVPRIDSGITAVWDARRATPVTLRFLDLLKSCVAERREGRQ